MPCCAPRPVPIMIAVGVARPSAQGQAMINTATALRIANVSAGCGPKAHHTAKVAAATTKTAGTKTAEIESASRWIGAFEPCASSTRRMMRASAESAPTAVARMCSSPVVFMVAPKTASPSLFSTGRDSPVSIDSSTAESPLMTSPSTEICSLGLTITTSPGCTAAIGISYSSPSSSTRASFGRSAISLRTASEVWPFARASSVRPRRINPMIAAAVSK